MANIKSAKQHIEINKRNRKKNLAWRSTIKSLMKGIEKLESATKEEVQAKLKEVHRTFDRVPEQAVSKSKANKLKSRAAKMLKELATA